MSETEIVGLDRLNLTLDRMIEALSPAGKKRLLAYIARRVTAQNRQRIDKNITPEGVAFAPRKTKRGKGKIRNRMFSKLKTAQWLKSRSTQESAQIRFVGTAAGMARVHHFGLRDKLAKHLEIRIQYPARPLLGVSPDDRSMIEDMILSRLTEAI